MKRSKFIVIAAPSGSGKTTIVNKLLNEKNLGLSFSINILSNENIKYNYYPKELSVKYFISIDDYKKTTPIDFRIESTLDKNKSILIPYLTKKPDFIKNARLSSNQIQLIILE